MGKTLTANTFSVKSLRALQKELERYRDSLQGKMERFITLLLEEGIKVAREYSQDDNEKFGTHQFGKSVFFYHDPVETSDGKVYGVLIGEGDDIPAGTYYVNDGKGNYTPITGDSINALLALEFGTAAQALPQQSAFGVTGGQGTLSKYGHENDMAWKIVTALGKDKDSGRIKPIAWKTATSVKPTQPMYHAGLAMYQKVKEAAITAFRS